MYWLLLPVAGIALYFGFRTPSPGAMAGWMLLALAMIVLWAYFRFRAVFPGSGSSEYVLSPMDAEEIKRIRAQADAERGKPAGAAVSGAGVTSHARPAATRRHDEPDENGGFPLSLD